ncbi:hypothetical protein SSPO_001620 [Streptomyces antimycoticus]|uniref:Uncharacterized protein n=1 Tax=Streptomyces antimycoticus TaxID=68175 RepID=A0A499U9V8_9ACTN|nr:hypothetical protein SSPO_001620 [Streptomyces antimycoticus]
MGVDGYGQVPVQGGVGAGVGQALAWRVAARRRAVLCGYGGRPGGAEAGKELLLGGVEAVPQLCLCPDPAAFGPGQGAAVGGGAGPVVGALPGEGPGRVPVRVEGIERGDPGGLDAPVGGALALAQEPTS